MSNTCTSQKKRLLLNIKNKQNMKSPKVTKDQIIEGAEFDLKVGICKIVSVEKDGYKKGLDLVRTTISGRDYADGYTEVLWFINSNRK